MYILKFEKDLERHRVLLVESFLWKRESSAAHKNGMMKRTTYGWIVFQCFHLLELTCVFKVTLQTVYSKNGWPPPILWCASKFENLHSLFQRNYNDEQAGLLQHLFLEWLIIAAVIKKQYLTQNEQKIPSTVWVEQICFHEKLSWTVS